MMFKNTLLPSRIFCQRLLHNYSELKYLAINGNSYTVSVHVIIKFIGVHSVTGESQNPDGQVALLDYREDGVTPYMLFFKDGIKEEKYVRCSSTFRTDLLLIILMCYRHILSLCHSISTHLNKWSMWGFLLTFYPFFSKLSPEVQGQLEPDPSLRNLSLSNVGPFHSPSEYSETVKILTDDEKVLL